MMEAVTTFQKKPALLVDLNSIKSHKELANKIKSLATYKEEGHLILGVFNTSLVSNGVRTTDEINHDVKRFIDTASTIANTNLFNACTGCYDDPNGKIAPYNRTSLLILPEIGQLVLLEQEVFEVDSIIIDWGNSEFVSDNPKLCPKELKFTHIDLI